MKVAIVHDYLTQRGGAERVVLSMMKAFPDAPVYTSLYDPDKTLPEFAGADIRTLGLNRSGLLRRNHRLALPFLAPSFSSLTVDADVTICSSSGWAHGVRSSGRKLVYCYSPARWLYDQADRYTRGRNRLTHAGLAALQPSLRRWDRRAAHEADRYVVISTAIRDRVRRVYGIDADVVAPPHSLDVNGPETPVAGLEPGFALCVSRLLPYKNVDAAVDAFAELPANRLVVVGTGPELERLRQRAGANVHFTGRISDESLRWIYRNCACLVAPSYEDFGLVPLEGACFAKPVAALRWGGFLDTVIEGRTGLFFDQPVPSAIAATVKALLERQWDRESLLAQARRYDEESFVRGLRSLVEAEALAA